MPHALHERRTVLAGLAVALLAPSLSRAAEPVLSLATGARVIAHSAIQYEPIEAAPPSAASGQRRRA